MELAAGCCCAWVHPAMKSAISVRHANKVFLRLIGLSVFKGFVGQLLEEEFTTPCLRYQL
jgi:hypothetical protein